VVIQDVSNSYTWKMEVAWFPKTSVHIYQTTRRHIQDDYNTYIHHCENIKSHKDVFCFDFVFWSYCLIICAELNQPHRVSLSSWVYNEILYSILEFKWGVLEYWNYFKLYNFKGGFWHFVPHKFFEITHVTASGRLSTYIGNACYVLILAGVLCLVFSFPTDEYLGDALKWVTTILFRINYWTLLLHILTFTCSEKKWGDKKLWTKL
jgi:hypothetical protein